MIDVIAAVALSLHKHADVWVALSLLVANEILGFGPEQRASAAVTALRSKVQLRPICIR